MVVLIFYIRPCACGAGTVLTKFSCISRSSVLSKVERMADLLEFSNIFLQIVYKDFSAESTEIVLFTDVTVGGWVIFL